MQKKNWKLKFGIFSMILSILVFILLLLIPFLKIDTKSKLTVTTIIIVAGEILFWTGGILVGKEMFTKYKTYLNPKKWFKRKMEEV
jgi:uncharacterized membrane protein